MSSAKSLPKASPKKTRAPPLIKLRERPSAAAFRAGAAQLDRINDRVRARKAPVFLCLSSDEESEGSEGDSAPSSGTRCHNTAFTPTSHGGLPAAQVKKAPPPRQRQRRRPIVPESDDDEGRSALASFKGVHLPYSSRSSPLTSLSVH